MRFVWIDFTDDPHSVKVNPNHRQLIANEFRMWQYAPNHTHRMIYVYTTSRNCLVFRGVTSCVNFTGVGRLREDRMYVVKDQTGRVFKIVFVLREQTFQRTMPNVASYSASGLREFRRLARDLVNNTGNVGDKAYFSN